MKFSTYDKDNDNHSSHCALNYSNSPWWFKSCWSGSIVGGGENWGQNHYNGAYWLSSDNIWGNKTTAKGAGNGWYYVK